MTDYEALWNVTAIQLANGRTELEDAIPGFRARGLTVTEYTDNYDMLLFLYSKKVMERRKTREVRDLEFSYIVSPEMAKDQKDEYLKCRSRLESLLKHNGDETSDNAPADVQTFESALTQIGAWRTEYVFHRDHKNFKHKNPKPNVICQRHQLSGMCYIHGPAVLQHYLVWLSQGSNPGMIDVSKMVRETFVVEELQKHIFEEEGGNSLKMLERILLPGSIVLPTFIDNVTVESMEQSGPLLVSEFTVYNDFKCRGKFSYTGNPTGDFIGHHAMVLIGTRVTKDECGEVRFFLLQNWWKDKQFVEVDAGYLKACGAKLYSVQTAQTGIPNTFPVQTKSYAECEDVDKPETYACLEFLTSAKPTDRL